MTQGERINKGSAIRLFGSLRELAKDGRPNYDFDKTVR